MPDKIYTSDPDFPEFEFDSSFEATKDLKWTATKRPVENTGNVADHVYREPFTGGTNGIVAVTPYSPRGVPPSVSSDPSVMKNAQAALTEVANKEDLVNVVSDVYTGPAVITSLGFAKAVADGHSLRVAITFSEVGIAKSRTTRIANSRLKPKVKRRDKSKGGIKASEQVMLQKYRESLGIKQSKLSEHTGG